MNTDYDNDKKMAEYGRYCAVQKAIRKAKEGIRNNAVYLGNSETVGEVIEYKDLMNEQITALEDALMAKDKK